MQITDLAGFYEFSFIRVIMRVSAKIILVDYDLMAVCVFISYIVYNIENL